MRPLDQPNIAYGTFIPRDPDYAVTLAMIDARLIPNTSREVTQLRDILVVSHIEPAAQTLSNVWAQVVVN